MSNWQSKVGEIGNKVTDAVEQQKQRFAQSQEAGAIQKQIQLLLEKKAELYFDAGKRLHDFSRKGNKLPEGLDVLDQELLEIDVNIFSLQEKLNLLEQQSENGTLCTECKEPLQVGDKFCGSCGTKQEKPKVGPKVQCKHCEQDIPEEAKFCNICGMSQSAVKNYAL